MEIGKLKNNLLDEIIFSTLKDNFKHNCVLKGPNFGEDCAILKLDEKYCVLSTDPITFTSKNIGKLSVKINLNDLVVSGAKPVGLMLTILLPPKTPVDQLRHIMKDIVCEANKFGLEILGGHTEVTDAVNRTIISATIIGQTNKIADNKILPSDKILITKWIGLEATFILANEHKKYLERKFGRNFVESCFELEKYLTVDKEADIFKNFDVHKMHDVTEGGILGALEEVFLKTNLGYKLNFETIPILPVTKIICEEFSLNPYEIISSGSLIAFINKNDEGAIKEKLKNENINVVVIGEVANDKKDDQLNKLRGDFL